MASSVPPAVVQRVSQLIQEGISSGERLTAWDLIKSILLSEKLAWYARLPPECVATHERNRSSLGVGGSEAHHLGARILRMGFSWPKCEDCTAFAAPASLQRQTEAIQKNKEWSDLSGGMIPPLSQLLAKSVAGSHTNTFFRAVKAGAPTPVSSLADSTGHLNMDLLTVNRPAFKDALTDGLKWLVIADCVDEALPKLAGFIEKSLNTKAQQDKSEIEVMLEMFDMAQSSLAKKTNPDWSQIIESCKHSLPSCSAYLDVIAQYVKTNAGGIQGNLLQELNEFFKVFGCSDTGPSRFLGSEFIGKLTNIKFGAGECFPLVVNACIKVQLMSPKQVDGFCKFLSASHLTSLTAQTNQGQVSEAERLMSDARKLVDTLQPTASLRTQALGRLDVRCVLTILKKTKEFEGVEFTSIAAVAKVIKHAWP